MYPIIIRDWKSSFNPAILSPSTLLKVVNPESVELFQITGNVVNETDRNTIVKDLIVLVIYQIRVLGKEGKRSISV